MNAHTNVTVIKDAVGNPAFVVLPFSDYVSLTKPKQTTVPNTVVNLVFDNNWTTIRAWREYLNFSQEDVANRLGISQAAYSKQENSTRLRTATKQKIAIALEIDVEQLDF